MGRKEQDRQQEQAQKLKQFQYQAGELKKQVARTFSFLCEEPKPKEQPIQVRDAKLYQADASGNLEGGTGDLRIVIDKSLSGTEAEHWSWFTAEMNRIYQTSQASIDNFEKAYTPVPGTLPNEDARKKAETELKNSLRSLIDFHRVYGKSQVNEVQKNGWSGFAISYPIAPGDQFDSTNYVLGFMRGGVADALRSSIEKSRYVSSEEGKTELAKTYTQLQDTARQLVPEENKSRGKK